MPLTDQIFEPTGTRDDYVDAVTQGRNCGP